MNTLGISVSLAPAPLMPAYPLHPHYHDNPQTLPHFQMPAAAEGGTSPAENHCHEN